MNKYNFAVFMKSESGDSYTSLYNGTAKSVLEQIKKEHDDELGYMCDYEIDSENKKVGNELGSLLETAIAEERDKQ